MTELTKLAEFVFLVLLNYAGPGRSEYSMETMPECGASQANPACEVKRLCEDNDFHCAEPRWSKSRNAWVRPERREAAALRMRTAAIALDRTIIKMTTCLVDGVPDEDCKPVWWPGGREDMAFSILTASYWESGYREDIMVGAAPSGRGAGGEGCIMQVMPYLAKQFSPWLTDEQREELTDEQVIRMMLGTDVASLSRCYETGARLLMASRKIAPTKCAGADPIYSMFALYGTGSSCTTIDHPLGNFALKRSDWWRRRAKQWRAGITIPKWAKGFISPAIP